MSSATCWPRQPAPALSEFRLFWETMGTVLRDRPKLILDGASGRPQRLFLSRLPMEEAAALAGPGPEANRKTAKATSE